MLKLLTFIVISAALPAWAERYQVPLKIAIALNESRPSSSTSNPIEKHIRSAVSLALKDSAALKPEVTWVNHGESVAHTVQSLKDINKIAPAIVVGLTDSYQALLAANHLNSNIVLISPSATSDEILKSRKPIVLMGNINSVQAKLLVQEIKHRFIEKQKVLLIEVIACPYCVNMSKAVASNLNRTKIPFMVSQIHYSDLEDARRILAPLSGFDHIVLPAHEAESARLIQALFPQNSNAIFWGGDGWGNLARFIRELPFAKRLKAFWLSHYHASIDTPENRHFVSSFSGTYKIEPVDTSAFFYESVRIIFQLRDTSSPAAILKSFKQLNGYRGLTGEIKINGHHVLRPMPLLALVNGEVNLQKMLVPNASN